MFRDQTSVKKMKIEDKKSFTEDLDKKIEELLNFQHNVIGKMEEVIKRLDKILP